jgi:hypothetical protein
MTRTAELSELEHRLRRIEFALLDAQARLPGLAAEIRAIRHRMTLTACDDEPTADTGPTSGAQIYDPTPR